MRKRKVENPWPELLQKFRDRYDLNQTDLAYLLDVSQSTISRYEHGQQYPDMPFLLNVVLGLLQQYLEQDRDLRNVKNRLRTLAVLNLPESNKSKSDNIPVTASALAR